MRGMRASPHEQHGARETQALRRLHVQQQQLRNLGARPVLRENFKTDNGNLILDVHGMAIVHPEQLERDWNQIPGVVTVGLFALRRADVVICAGETLALT